MDIKTLNVGCGPDAWGDVRLDIAKQYCEKKTAANIHADAQNLPFRDGVFKLVRANNILEHLPVWKQAVKEWCRVTEKLEILVPVNADILKKEIYVEIFSGNIRSLLHLPKCRTEHLWQFEPNNIIEELRKNGLHSKLIIVKGSLVFRDDNRLANSRFIKWIRIYAPKLNLHFKITAQKSEKNS